MSLNSSLHPEYCNFPELNSMSTALLIIYLSLLPLFLFVIFVGFQRWRKHRSGSAAVASSHLDIFTYNVVTLELISIAGSSFYNFGTYVERLDLKMVGMYLFSIIVPGQTMFHALTCVDRYLAVVHPITYLSLKQRGGAKIRNASIACVWLNCLGVMVTIARHTIPIDLICLFFIVLSAVTISFCSISVLYVLIRPKPGEEGGNRGGVDQSKQRAFNTVMVIAGVLLLRFFTNSASTVLEVLLPYGFTQCVLTISAVWFQVPSSLVLPLLFLQRVGKLGGCKRKPVRAP